MGQKDGLSAQAGTAWGGPLGGRSVHVHRDFLFPDSPTQGGCRGEHGPPGQGPEGLVGQFAAHLWGSRSC